MSDLTRAIEELEAKVARLTSRGFEDLHHENEQLRRLLKGYIEDHRDSNGIRAPEGHLLCGCDLCVEAGGILAPREGCER